MSMQPVSLAELQGVEGGWSLAHALIGGPDRCSGRRSDRNDRGSDHRIWDPHWARRWGRYWSHSWDGRGEVCLASVRRRAALDRTERFTCREA